MNCLPIERQKLLLDLVVEGGSLRGISRATGHHRNTIVSLMHQTAENCAAMMDNLFVDLELRSVQVDEVWTFVGCKQQRLSKSEKNGQQRGDQFLFYGLDSDSKLIPAYAIGKRTSETAYRFMRDLRRRVGGVIQLSTDSFAGYADSVDRAFGVDIHYAQVTKYFVSNGRGRHESYSPRAIARTLTSIQQGKPDLAFVRTSFIERANLTLRQSLRRFARLSLGFSKKLECLISAVAIYVWAYNFKRGHQTLSGLTPAMAANVVPGFVDWDVVLN